MFQKIKNQKKTSALKSTPGESVRDAILSSNTAEKAADIIKGATALAGGTQSADALGKIIFKASKDVARGDTVCTGLCVVSGTCEAVSICCSTLKIPFRGSIYVGAKIISKGCMTFRNACAGEGC